VSRRRGAGPCAKYLVGEDGRLCPICGQDYVVGQALRDDGCPHVMADLEDHAAKKLRERMETAS
jgi:hypothetical protein